MAINLINEAIDALLVEADVDFDGAGGAAALGAASVEIDAEAGARGGASVGGAPRCAQGGPPW